MYPEAITFPTTPGQVAKIVEIAGKHKRRVVPLSGGVSLRLGLRNGIFLKVDSSLFFFMEYSMVP